MISKEIIKELINKYQTSEPNVWREYFQHLFLSYFYQQQETDKIYFKGGTALRLIYKSPRFSEDLDFTVSLRDIKTIEGIVIKTLSEIEREGVKASLHEAKPTTGGYLAIASFRNNGDTIKIQMEFSLRPGKKRGETTVIAGDFIPPYNIVHLAKDELVAEKIAALLNRKKPRDFYDLYFILRADLLPPEKKKILPETLDTLKSANINFSRELKEFLPKSHWTIIRNFSAALEREIGRFIK